MARHRDLASDPHIARGLGFRRRDAHVRALTTMLLLFAATFVIFLANNFVRGTTDRVFRVGTAMIGGDILIALPLVWLIADAGRKRSVARWGGYVLGAILVAVAQGVWDTAVRAWIGTIAPGFAVKSFANALPIDLYNTGMLVGILAFQAAYHRIVAQQRVLTGVRERERRANLAALRLQLNPHFLFNAMNALSSLVVVGRNADAEAMIDELSDFLRHVLAIDPTGLDRLDQEVALTEAYLAIEQIRFGERLAIEVELPAALAHFAVPPFLLQPLVENAIKYAVAPARRVVTVRVAAQAEGDTLRLDVTDDGDAGVATGGMGVGLANVRERLALHYGAAASLEAGPAPHGYRATIRLPQAPG